MRVQGFVLAAAAVLWLSPTAFGGETYEFSFQKTITAATPQITITNPIGAVTVTATTEDNVRIEAVKRIYADSKEEAETAADNIQIEVSDTQGHLMIGPRVLNAPDRSPSFWQKLLGRGDRSGQGSVDFVISVPTDCAVDVYSPLGTAIVAGIRGRVNVSGEVGEVTVQDVVGPVLIGVSSGAVTVKDVEGNVEIKANGSMISFFSIHGDLEIRNSSGGTSGEYLIGDVTISQADGEVALRGIEGDIRVKTASGRVEVEQDMGALDVGTETGDINITTELNSSKDYFVETISGSIRFLVPEASSGKVKLEAGSCDIDTQIPIAIDSFSRTRISGSFGSGGPKITLATMSGGIMLAEF